ncbi:MAG: DUF167 domain-containing protein [Kordiimonadaceae bacterium]|nr:DUF167 domain-containing protein [Kordiimonadaceae bacterium]
MSLEPLLALHRDGATLSVKLTPNASKDAFVRVDRTADGKKELRATVTAVPEKGKANAALIKLLSKKLRIPKSSVQLIKGGQNQHKTILIEGPPDEILSQLKNKFRIMGLLA